MRKPAPRAVGPAVQVSTSLLSRSIRLTPVAFDPPEFAVTLSSSADLVVGDLLRLTFENGTILMCAVKSIESNASSPPQPNQSHVTCDKAIWFKSSWQQLPLTQTGHAYSFAHETDNGDSCHRFRLGDQDGAFHQTRPRPGICRAPKVGSLLRVNFVLINSGCVEDVSAGNYGDSPLSIVCVSPDGDCGGRPTRRAGGLNRSCGKIVV
jgi:hypothetical protein